MLPYRVSTQSKPHKDEAMSQNELPETAKTDTTALRRQRQMCIRDRFQGQFTCRQ